MNLRPEVNGTHGKLSCSGKSCHPPVPPCQEYRVTMNSTEELVWGYFKISLIQGFWDWLLAQSTQADAKCVWIWNFLLETQKLHILVISLSNFCNEISACPIVQSLSFHSKAVFLCCINFWYPKCLWELAIRAPVAEEGRGAVSWGPSCTWTRPLRQGHSFIGWSGIHGGF